MKNNKLERDINYTAVLMRLHVVFDVSSDAELARKLNLHETAVGTWRRRRSLHAVVKVALKYGLSLDWLLLGRGSHTYVDQRRARQEKEISPGFTCVSLEEMADGLLDNGADE